MIGRVEKLSVNYGQRQAVRDVSLTLARGELVALIGPNGSGKSSLIKSLLGLVPFTGTIEWDSNKLQAIPPRDLAKIVAYLPQSPVWEPIQTVYDVLRLGRFPYWKLFGVESSDDAQIIETVAREWHLTDFLTRPMDELSGGQRQRVFLARCLVQGAKTLLLDEPNTYLDLKHQIELCTALKSLTREKGMTVLMAVHDLNLAGMFADRVVLLSEGSIALQGSAKDVFESPKLSEVYGLNLRTLDGKFVMPA